jgi:hypothetical protein
MRGCSSIASNTGTAHLQRKTQKADRFWFAPRAAKKAGQWRLRTRRCCNHARLFLDRSSARRVTKMIGLPIADKDGFDGLRTTTLIVSMVL